MPNLEELVCDALARDERFGMPARATLRAAPVLNWGGFVNQSFVVSGGDRKLHVKLSRDADTLRGLRRWWMVHERLTERCGAPRMLGWIALPTAALEGAVLEWIDGVSPMRRGGDELRTAGALLSALHDDAALARWLGEHGDAVHACATVYAHTLHDRYVEDLRGIRAAPPPFLSRDVLQWMTREADRLLRQVKGAPAFRDAATVATHHDPWRNNCIVTPTGRVHLLDWDDLALGDPMMDWALLLGPDMHDLRPADPADLPHDAFSPSERDRFALWSRASLLDWVIDSLADWVEAEGHPQQDIVRQEKQRVHETALASYRARYG